MARKLAGFLFLLVGLLSLSCKSRDNDMGKISIDVSSLFTKFSCKIANPDASVHDTYTLELHVTGDFEWSQSLSGKLSDFKKKTVTLPLIPLGSKVSVSIKIYRNARLCYSGSSEPETIVRGQKSLAINMKKNCEEKIPSDCDEELFSSPVISATGGKFDPVAMKYVVNQGKAISFSVRTLPSLPEGAKCLWYINDTLIEGVDSSSITIDYSSAECVSVTNTVMVLVSYGGIIKSASFDFLVKVE